MILKIVDGGKANAAAANGGAGEQFKQHPLAGSLYRAIYPNDAKTFEQMRARVSKYEKEEIAAEAVGRCLRHVRDNEDEYGWTVPPVQKGRGKHRRYYVVHAAAKGVDSKISDEHLECFDKGMISAVGTVTTQIGHVLGAAELVAESDGMGRGQRRQYRALASQLAGAHAMALKIINELREAS